jgi:3-methyladenine DNA glycosylase AlkD
VENPGVEEVLSQLHALKDPSNLEGQAHFGIDVSSSLGISAPKLRALAKASGRHHGLAMDLWASGVREARLLACLVDDPEQVTAEQMDAWVAEFNSWEIVDGCCCNLFDRTPFAYRKAIEWSEREEEFVKRAAFSLMACLAVHDRSAPDSVLEQFFPIIVREGCDRRNFVRKAVNWALRQIGKRNVRLNKLAIETATVIKGLECKGALWIANDALKELQSSAVRARLKG